MTRHRKWAGRHVGAAPSYVFLLFILLTPLPFGTYYQWSWAGLGIVLAFLLGYSAIGLAFNKGSLPSPLRGLWGPASLYLMVVGWVAYQGVDTPWAHDLWDQTSEALARETRRSISLDPYTTWSEFLKLLIFAGVFWLAVLYGRESDRARRALLFVVLAGAGYALYGLFAYYTDLGAYLWFHPMERGEGISGTMVNRNFFANYLGYGLLAVLALLFDRLTHLSQLSRHRIARLKRLARGEDSSVLLLVSCALILMATLLLTESRGGVAAAILAIVALVLCFARGTEKTQSSGRALARLGYGTLALFVAVYIIAGGDLGFRLMESSMSDMEGRIEGYELLLQAIRDVPLTGLGAGNSPDVSYLYNDGRFWGAFNYAHSHYLGAIVELGLPAALLLFASVGWIGIACLKGVRRRRRDRIFPALGVSVLVLLAIHGLIDSPFVIPANTVTFSFLLGLAYAQSWPTHTKGHHATGMQEADLARQGPRERAEGQGEQRQGDRLPLPR